MMTGAAAWSSCGTAWARVDADSQTEPLGALRLPTTDAAGRRRRAQPGAATGQQRRRAHPGADSQAAHRGCTPPTSALRPVSFPALFLGRQTARKCACDGPRLPEAMVLAALTELVASVLSSLVANGDGREFGGGRGGGDAGGRGGVWGERRPSSPPCVWTPAQRARRWSGRAPREWQLRARRDAAS